MNKTKWLLTALVVCSLLMSCGMDADYDDMDGETAEETESIDMEHIGHEEEGGNKEGADRIFS